MMQVFLRKNLLETLKSYLVGKCGKKSMDQANLGLLSILCILVEYPWVGQLTSLLLKLLIYKSIETCSYSSGLLRGFNDGRCMKGVVGAEYIVKLTRRWIKGFTFSKQMHCSSSRSGNMKIVYQTVMKSPFQVPKNDHPSLGKKQKDKSVCFFQFPGERQYIHRILPVCLPSISLVVDVK